MAWLYVFQSLSIPVETHAFLNQHMWWIFLAPALTSPWQPIMRGGTSKITASCLGILSMRTETYFFSRLWSHFPLHEVLSSRKFCYKVCYFSTIFPVFEFWHHTAEQNHKLLCNNPTFNVMPKENKWSSRRLLMRRWTHTHTQCWIVTLWCSLALEKMMANSIIKTNLQ